ncbi:MAG: plasmid pRiA4b ORF-3 family protein, partial [Merismopedia sp. SIO2A8]|nr:plasmid pRiA4b ORF-3 family protein [Merismopedia sp. SIO2A8]
VDVQVPSPDLDLNPEAGPESEAIAYLTEQTITDRSPGPILHDFQVLLEAIGNNGLPVSDKTQCIPIKRLGELNAQMAQPITIGLKRPQQKSYPNIHGLCLLLRASGLGTVTKKGKKAVLRLNPKLGAIWQQLNPTEQYCALLEAWIIRGNTELFGDDRGHRSDQDTFDLWQMVIPRLKQGNHNELLNYASETYNVALMHLFGLLDIQSAAPKAGKGWQIKSFKQTPFGLALMSELQRAYYQNGRRWQSDRDPSLPLNELQGTLQPYFPEWQQCLP